MDDSEQNLEKLSDDSQLFWDKIEGGMKVKLPTYVKNILHLSNLDNHVAFQCIDNATIDTLESFVRDSMIYQLDDGMDHRLFFGNYFKTPEKFMFAIGDRHLIKKFVTFAQTKDEKFWCSNVGVSSKRVGNNSSQCGPGIVDPLSSVNADATIKDETIQVKKMLKTLLSSLMKKEQQPWEKENKNDNQDDDSIANLDDDDNSPSSLDDNTEANSGKNKAKGCMPLTASVDELNPQVSRKELYGPDGLSINHTFVLSVDCYICKKRIDISKTIDKKTGKHRWVLTNYSRHVRSQHDASSSSKNQGQKRKNVSVLQLFQNMKKSKKESVNENSSFDTIEVIAEVHQSDGNDTILVVSDTLQPMSSELNDEATTVLNTNEELILTEESLSSEAAGIVGDASLNLPDRHSGEY